MIYIRKITTALLLLITISLYSQSTTIEGYIYESGNRGYLPDVSITAENIDTDKILGKTKSDKDGYFIIEVPQNIKIRIYAAKDMYDIKKLETEIGVGKSFVKLEMGRAPGYTFEVTLAEKKSTHNAVVDAITGTRIEVYNNTTRKPVMDLKEHDAPTFQLNLEKGNHYTILIRKNGFLSKRMEAKVDVEGCILCFEGIGNVDPGVSENLTENNAFGVLLANVELERIFEGKTMEVQNLYYDLGEWGLTDSARVELNKVITLMKDNPNLTIELGAHTDSRGNAQLNMDLSEKRARSAVKYLIQKGDISKSRIIFKGYGENNLLNDCTDGVECTEKEHAINRRTELKIVGITDITEVKSLEQMKKEAQLEAEILNLMDQEQVQAKDEEELKKIIAEKEKQENENKADQSVEEEFSIQSDDSVKAEEQSIKTIVQTEEQQIEEAEKIVNTEKLEDIDSIVVNEKVFEAIPEEVQEFELETKLESELEIVDADIKEELRENSTEVMDSIISKEEFEAEETSLPQVTDGIKAVLYQSDSLLQKDHFIHLRHKNLEIYKNNEGKYYYMIGDFLHEQQALNFISYYIAPDKKYKEPFVIIFKEGKLSSVSN